MCKLQEEVSLAAVGLSIVGLCCGCADFGADDALFFQVGTVVYIDRLR